MYAYIPEEEEFRNSGGGPNIPNIPKCYTSSATRRWASVNAAWISRAAMRLARRGLWAAAIVFAASGACSGEDPADGGEAADPSEQYGSVPVAAPVNVGTTLLKMSPEQVAMASSPWEGTDPNNPIRGFPRQDPWDTPGDSTDHTPFAHRNLIPARPPPYIPSDVDWGIERKRQQDRAKQQEMMMQTHWAREVNVPSLPAIGPALYGKDLKPEGYYINPLKPSGGLLGQMGLTRRLRFLEIGSQAGQAAQGAKGTAQNVAYSSSKFSSRRKGIGRWVSGVARTGVESTVDAMRRRRTSAWARKQPMRLRGAKGVTGVGDIDWSFIDQGHASTPVGGGAYPVEGGSGVGQGLAETANSGYTGIAPRPPPGTFTSNFANPLQAGPQYENNAEAARALAAVADQVWPPWGTKMGDRRIQKAIKYIHDGTPTVIENPDGFPGARMMPPVQNTAHEIIGVLPGLPGNPGLPGVRL